MNTVINYQDIDKQLASMGMAELHTDGDLWATFYELKENYNSPQYRVYISKHDESVLVEIADFRFDPEDHFDDKRQPEYR